MGRRAASANCRFGWIVVALVLIVAGCSTPVPGAAAKAVFFHSLPPGAKLPSGALCAKLVNASPQPEDKSANKPYNSRKGRHVGAKFLASDGPGADKLVRRITGDFTGTTIDILRWPAFKWAIAQAPRLAQPTLKGWWNQATSGPGTTAPTRSPPG